MIYRRSAEIFPGILAVAAMEVCTQMLIEASSAKAMLPCSQSLGVVRGTAGRASPFLPSVGFC